MMFYITLYRALNAYNQLGNCFTAESDIGNALVYYMKSEEYICKQNLEVEQKLRSKLYLNIGAILFKKYLIKCNTIF